MQFILPSPPPTQILTKINEPKDLLHLERWQLFIQKQSQNVTSHLFLPQTPTSWYGSWLAAPRAPWRCPSRSPQTWSRFDSRRRWTWTAWRVATAAPCRPTNTSTRTRVSGDSGKVPSLTWALPHRKRPLRHGCLVVSPGTLPNITRNALVNCTELVTYDMIKEAILRHKLMSGVTHKHILTFLSLWGLLWT